MQASQMEHHEYLFVKTLDDIEARLNEVEPYEILMISGLIRKLFLNNFPLVDRVNQKYKEKISFEIAVPYLLDDIGEADLYFVQDGIDPDTSLPFKKRHFIDRNRFFQTIVCILNGKRYSIRNCVLFQANVMGAIHAGIPKVDKEKLLHGIDSNISIGGYPSSLRQLKAIVRVVVKALTGLKGKVVSSN